MNNETLLSTDRYLGSDNDFDQLYPEDIQFIGRRHWTPVHIARLATGFLANDNAKILDIGSGVGKFCLTAAYHAPNAEIIGVEQRKYLINHAVHAQKKLGLNNVSFLNKNFTQINLRDYDHFYFFNSFFENINDIERIDETIDYSEALFEYYVRYLYKGLKQMPEGTKIATYHTFDEEIPRGYKLFEKHANGDLKFWIKQ